MELNTDDIVKGVEYISTSSDKQLNIIGGLGMVAIFGLVAKVLWHKWTRSIDTRIDELHKQIEHKEKIINTQKIEIDGLLDRLFIEKDKDAK